MSNNTILKQIYRTMWISRSFKMASNCAKCQGIGITPVKNERRNIIYPSTEDNNQEVNIYFGPISWKQYLKQHVKTEFGKNDIW